MAAVTVAPATVRPERLRAFGDPAGATFWLVTEPDVAAALAIEPGAGYDDHGVVTWDGDEPFAELLARRVPEGAHVLVITPGRLFVSPEPAELGRRKLVAMACGSTPTTIDHVAHFLSVMERTDPYAQDAFAERFFAIAEESERLEIVDEHAGTVATFDHLGDEYEWNQQTGVVDWGDQQLAPAGELSVLPAHVNRFDPSLRLAVDGQLALRGFPVLHGGAASYTPEDQARLHAELATTADHAVVADVDGGVITAVTATHPAAEPAAAVLDAMFRVDSRYRVLWEVGFGINTELEPAPGNVAMNEVYGGTGGVFHFGVGLTPYTQYAPIFVCPGSRVTGAGGQELVAGVRARRRIRVQRGVGCGCRS